MFKNILFILFKTMFEVSAFTFGGGYVVIPMIERKLVDKYHYFTQEEMLNMATIAQSSPGAIAINLSALSGYRVAGLKGVFVCAFGSILPPLILLGIISSCYEAFIANHMIAAILQGMEAGVVALIVDVLITMSSSIVKSKDPFLYILLGGSFVACFFLQINAFLILIVSILICIVYVWKRGAKPCC